MTEPSAKAQAGNQRRRAQTDARIAPIVVRQLAEFGYGGLTIERVAAESGVAKTTIYRRWPAKAEMVFDLAIHQVEREPIADTGSLAGDLRSLTARVVELISTQPGRSVFPGLVFDMARDPELTRRIREGFFLASQPEVAAVLERAVNRGELVDATGAQELHVALLGIVFAQVHLVGEEDLGALTDSVTGQLLTLVTHRQP